MVVTRFAPSPNGHLHLGHAYAALFAYEAARRAGGCFLLRIEDIDQGRARPEFEAAILGDLEWLGLAWETPVRRQSEHFDDYAAALGRLEALGVVYPCFCTRKEIAEEIRQSPSAPQGPEGPLYPGTCRSLSAGEVEARRAAGRPFALRLDLARAIALAGGPLAWRDAGRGRIVAAPERLGDVVLARKEVPTSYHLAVTVDDHLQGVTLVTRGEDLIPATDVHRLLQALLGYVTPDYHHHALIQDPGGHRLAKREQATTLAALRESGITPEEIRRLVGLA
jgi:glutamyl-Q tRNA(Asp) synthetase